jgi:hypothetical protein
MPVAQPFTGKFRFSGNFAFLERNNDPDDALLQFDNPFTGVFDAQKASNTSNTLQAHHQSGDAANLSGLILSRQVNGQATPVLFLFA